MVRIRTLVVDDSALVRRAMSESLAREPDIEVVGTAVDPYAARDKIAALNPDVLTLDIEMPRMDGITFLKLIMKYRPMPVIVMSSLTTAGSDKALEALQAGAVEVIAKPSGSFSVANSRLLAEKIRAAAQSRLSRLPRSSGQTVLLERPAAPAPTIRPLPQVSPASSVPRVAHPGLADPLPGKLPAAEHARNYPARNLILMGASTGGTEALKSVLTRLPPDLPPILIVQHIPGYFSRAFADRLNQLCQLEVREAQAGDRVYPGLVLVAPGGFHLVLRWTVSGYTVDLNEGPEVHHQRPAVDVLFESALKAGAAPHSLALLLTGMGADGAAGMLRLREAGSVTVAQNEESCVVFGMPREAIRRGGAQEVLHLDHLAGRIDRYASSLSHPPAHPAAA
jgi:two-component system chemotaxis response regulator CheB